MSFPFYHFGIESIELNDMLNELIRNAYEKKYDYNTFLKEFDEFRNEYTEANTELVETKVFEFMKENNIDFP